MEIHDNPKPAVLTARLSGLNLKNQNFTTNQQLSAEVVKRLDNGQHLLKVQDQLISTHLDKALKPGQKLQIEILRLADPATVKIVTREPDKFNLAKTLRTLLPQQKPLTPLFQTISRVLSENTVKPSLPAALLNMLKHIQAQTIDSSQLKNSAILKQAMQNSGLFFDNRIAAGNSQSLGNFLENDLKANLLRLKALLVKLNQSQPAPGSNNSTSRATTYSPATQLPPIPGKENGLGLQQYRLAAQAADSSNTKSAAPLNSLNEQLKISELLKTTNQSNETKSNASLNLIRQLESQLKQLDALPPLRQFFPQAQAAEMISAKHFDSTDNLLRFLLRQVDGVLARMQITQLGSVPQENDSKTPWLFEIPIRRQDETTVFQLRVEYEEQPEHKDKEQTDEQPKQWSVQLAFELAGLGAVHVKLSLQAEQVSSQFWLQEAATLGLFEQHLPHLKTRFEALGFDIGNLSCCAGLPHNLADSESDNDYLDEQA